MSQPSWGRAHAGRGWHRRPLGRRLIPRAVHARARQAQNGAKRDNLATAPAHVGAVRAAGSLLALLPDANDTDNSHKSLQEVLRRMESRIRFSQ